MGKLKPINPTKAQIVANPQAAAHDYDNLTHKPQINGHELSGDQSGSDLGLQNQLTAGDNVTIENGVISASGGVSVTVSSAAVNQNGTITFTMSDDSTVTTTGESVIGSQGDDYVLTPQDKSDIAAIVLSELPTTQGVLYGELPTTQGVLYGNTSN